MWNIPQKLPWQTLTDGPTPNSRLGVSWSLRVCVFTDISSDYDLHESVCYRENDSIDLHLNIKFMFTHRWFHQGSSPHTKAPDWLYNGSYWNRNYSQLPDIYWPQTTADIWGNGVHVQYKRPTVEEMHWVYINASLILWWTDKDDKGHQDVKYNSVSCTTPLNRLGSH